MTNSEEPSAPDGISTSMKTSSESFAETQHLQHHQHTFGGGNNYANGDLRKGNNGNGTSSSCALPPPATSTSTAPGVGVGIGSGNGSVVFSGGGTPGSGSVVASYASTSTLSSSSSPSTSTSLPNSNPTTGPSSCEREREPAPTPTPSGGDNYINPNLSVPSHPTQPQHQQQHQHQQLTAVTGPPPPPPTSIQSNQHLGHHHHQTSTPPLPFTLICGEVYHHKTEVSDGTLVLTNYRLFLQTKESTYNLPLGLLESVECRDIFYLHLNCKDARAIRSTFPNNEAALEMLKRIQAAISPTKKVEDNFAFTFYKRTKGEDGSVGEEVRSHLGWELPPFPTPKERFDAEVKRMEFNVQGPWRISDENKDYELCNSYPTHIIVPCVMDKRKLEQVACFRSARRFPAVVWRHKGNGAVISRCSQPEVGWFGWRSNEDEELVQNIVLACADNGRVIPPEGGGGGGSSSNCKNEEKTNNSSPNSSSTLDNSSGDLYYNGGGGGGGGPPSSPGGCNSLSSMEVVPDPPNIKKLLILDARSYSTAVVNRARGGGCECLEYYTNCEIQFMNLANIHSIRKSFINVRSLCSLPADQANNNWFSQLESCKWLQHMSGLMKAAVTVGTAIENEARPVMVHCSDGWDRTPQIVALAEILLDPYYRSLEGFQVLVEREWLDFGHKFADRCGQGVGSEDANERCPVFLQWLDCLHQLIYQFPTAFEFNLTFLVKLAQHTYSNLFGTFLCNTAKERHALSVVSSTHSIWRFLRAPANYGQFRNHLYSNCDQVLWPCCEVRELKLWTQVYLGFDNPTPVLTEVINPSQESSPAPSVSADCEASERLSQSKARSSSCENLHPPHAGVLRRRKSDPSLSDSVLGIDSEEVESLCLPQTEKMLTAASKDIDHRRRHRTSSTNSESYQDYYDPSSSSVSNEKGQGQGRREDQELTNFNSSTSPIPHPELADYSENEEEETTEEKSAASVINLKYLKSIESSTDTLLENEGGVPLDPPPTSFTNSLYSYSSAVVGGGHGIQKFVMDVHNKTERDEVAAGVRADLLLRKTEPERRFLLDGNITLEGEENLNTEKRKNREAESNSNSKDLLAVLATLPQPQPGSDFDQIIGIPQQCEVCATSRKLLSEDVPSVSNSGMMTTSNSSTITSLSTAQSTNNLTYAAATAGLHVQGVGGMMPLPNLTSIAHPPTSASTLHIGGGGNNGGTNGHGHVRPVHSRTPSSSMSMGFPLSISTQEESVVGWASSPSGLLVAKHGHRHGGGGERWSNGVPSNIGTMLKPSFDVDGLEPLHDEVQSRLNVIISGYRGRIDNLQKELQMYRDALKKQVCHQCTHHHLDRADDAISVADSLCSGEHQSVGHESHSSEISNISWEAVDERDTRPPLWLPDYAVTRCMGCEATFWLGKRKHHCRSCGKIFCADCSEHAITIPSEQLFSPVRVCSTCFYRISSSLPPSTSGMNGSLNLPSSSSNSLVNGNGHLTLTMNGSYPHHPNHHGQNGVHNLHRTGSTSEYIPSLETASPKINSLNQIQHQNHRRMSEELPRKQSNLCNGSSSSGGSGNMKLKTKAMTSTSTSSNAEYQNGVGVGLDAGGGGGSSSSKTNGHLHH